MLRKPEQASSCRPLQPSCDLKDVTECNKQEKERVVKCDVLTRLVSLEFLIVFCFVLFCFQISEVNILCYGSNIF